MRALELHLLGVRIAKKKPRIHRDARQYISDDLLS
jgi:hypothetical protein